MKNKEYVSKCCNYNVIVSSGEEGTNYYICDKCKQPCDVIGKPKELDWEKVAFLFHNTYEGLAPKFGYETRKGTKAFDNKSQNGQLMIATCKAVVSHYLTQQRTELLEEIKKMEMKVDTTFWEEHERAMPKGYNQALKDIINLLNKKDE